MVAKRTPENPVTAVASAKVNPKVFSRLITGKEIDYQYSITINGEDQIVRRTAKPSGITKSFSGETVSSFNSFRKGLSKDVSSIKIVNTSDYDLVGRRQQLATGRLGFAGLCRRAGCGGNHVSRSVVSSPPRSKGWKGLFILCSKTPNSFSSRVSLGIS